MPSIKFKISKLDLITSPFSRSLSSFVRALFRQPGLSHIEERKNWKVGEGRGGCAPGRYIIFFLIEVEFFPENLLPHHG